MKKATKWAAGAAAGLTVVGMGVGASQLASADPTPTPGATASPSAPTSDQPGRAGGRGGPGQRGGGVDQAALASKLGVSEDKLAAAIKEVRQAQRSADKPAKPTTPPSEADRAARQAEYAKALAAKLGIDQAKVTAALDELRTERQEDHKERLQERLKQAVTDGKLTQAEADAVLKAFDAGVIGKR